MRRIFLSVMTVVAAVAVVAGATRAVFSETVNINGNTIATARVNIDLRSLVNKPINTQGLVPGQWTPTGKVDIYNESNSTPVVVYMYATNVSGVACDKTNLYVETGHAPNGTGNVRYNSTLAGITGGGNRVLLTSSPPFNTLGVNITQVITQRAQLDPSADDSYQATSCTWDEVFVAENVAP